VVEDLKAQGLLENHEEHSHSVGHCYRCHTMVEPILSKQWFVKVGPLAEKALDAVKTGNTRIVPEQWNKTYDEWMTNIRDWCVSRQIWWGHRIPAWYCECGEVIVSRDRAHGLPPLRLKGATAGDRRSGHLVQQRPVALLTMGWPEKTPLLKKFYPTSCLVTGFDILFFWVARMMMMGIQFMDEVPFTDVYIHALVRDANGRKCPNPRATSLTPLGDGQVRHRCLPLHPHRFCGPGPGRQAQ
jgi:valyl-tRNA synthetase